jgi:hypothetical protein
MAFIRSVNICSVSDLLLADNREILRFRDKTLRATTKVPGIAMATIRNATIITLVTFVALFLRIER